MARIRGPTGCMRQSCCRCGMVRLLAPFRSVVQHNVTCTLSLRTAMPISCCIPLPPPTAFLFTTRLALPPTSKHAKW